jgi:hypothetical protein
MKQSEIAKSLNIPVKIFIEMDSCMLTACQVSNFLDKISIIRYVMDAGWDRDMIQNRCGNDTDEMEFMLQEVIFINEMLNRGYTEIKKDDDMVWRYIGYWRNL